MRATRKFISVATGRLVEIVYCSYGHWRVDEGYSYNFHCRTSVAIFIVANRKPGQITRLSIMDMLIDGS